MSGIEVYESERAPGLKLHLREPGSIAQRLRGGPISPEVWTMYATIVEQTYNTEFVKRAIRGNAAACLACVLYGHDLGLPPLVALREIDIVDGRPAPGANLVTARIRDRGHSLSWEYMYDGDGNEVGCTARGVRADNGDTGEYTFTLKKAARAGLAGKGAWKSYPESMLWARSVTQLARMLFADVFLGSVYTPEELGADDERAGAAAGAAAPADTSATAPKAAVAPAPDFSGAVSHPDEARGTFGVQDEDGAVADDSSEGGADASDLAPAARSDAVETPSVAIPEDAGPRDAAPQPGERSYKRTDFKEHAKKWLITDEDRRTELLDAASADVFVRWDKHRTDAVSAINLVRDETNVDTLLLWADREARHRGRKGVLDAIAKRPGVIEDSGGGSPPQEEAAGPALRPESDPSSAHAAGTIPLPETLQRDDPLVRLYALLAYLRDNPGAVDNPNAWTEAGVLKGMVQAGMGAWGALSDADPDMLAEVWTFVPTDVRGFIEGLDAESVAKLAGSA